jgi:peptidoglycan/xylan/chitin deacetylase (PgdA/CDA1 family)
VLLDPISRHLLRHVGRIPASEGRGPVILLYHGIHRSGEADTGQWSLAINQFRDHMSVLKNEGFSTIRIRELNFDESECSRKVAITFDDGYKNNFDLAIPLLKDFGMTATWFVVTRGLGEPAPWTSSSLHPPELLAADDLRRMQAMGFEIGSHTRSHRNLTQIGSGELEAEVSGSRDDLEDILGNPVSSFAYPFGALNASCVDAVANAGYRHACSSNAGWLGSERHPFRIRRVAIMRNDTAAVFARKLAFADTRVSWSRIALYLAKRLRAHLRLFDVNQYS